VSGDDYNRLLNGSRVLVGLVAFAAPGRAFRGAGLDPRRNPQLPFMTRMFGVRDLVLGAGALGTSGAERRRWLQASLTSDLGDAVAALAGHRAGYLSTRGTVMLALPAITGAALGVAALAADDQ
jgi:hypothetical protein